MQTDCRFLPSPHSYYLSFNSLGIPRLQTSLTGFSYILVPRPTRHDCKIGNQRRHPPYTTIAFLWSTSASMNLYLPGKAILKAGEDTDFAKYPFVKIVYNLYFHPLKKIPGPGSWSCSRLPFVWALLKGTLIHDIERLHRKYGPVLRIAPDEVTFAKAEAYNDIFHSRPDHQVFLKDLVWWKRQPGHPDSLISAVNPDKHARIRRALTPAFTPLALKAQEPILQKYVDLLVAKLEEQVDQGISGEGFDISPWMHFTTFDIFGDLGFGESFNCLQHSEFHPWISILFNSVKAATYVAAARFYPIIEFMLMACIPPSLRKMQRDHYQLIADKVHRRMNWEMERPDIMSHVIQQQSVEKSLSIGEIEATFMILTTAGSETSATTLTGAIHYLTRCPEKLAILTTELSQTFQSRNQITLDILQNLPYINAVLQEALRLCPPLPWILPRRVPIGGGSVCGIQLPGGVSEKIYRFINVH
jgi:cytochrome P450